jgi:hypothetical protein
MRAEGCLGMGMDMGMSMGMGMGSRSRTEGHSTSRRTGPLALSRSARHAIAMPRTQINGLGRSEQHQQYSATDPLRAMQR